MGVCIVRLGILHGIIGFVGIIAFIVIVVAIIVTSKGKDCTKRLLGFLIPVCIISFIGFGVTRAIFGRESSHTESYYENLGQNWIFSTLAETDDSWEVVNEFPDIHLNSAGATVIVNQTDSDRIQIAADVPAGREVFVGAYYYDDDLVIEVRPEYITFMDFVDDFGKVFWNNDVFNYPEGVTVTISFPKTVYDYLTIQQGSGKLYIDELYARNEDITVGSGTFEMRRENVLYSDFLNLTIGSGNVKMDNIRPSVYSIDMGSGKFAISSFFGDGAINIGSGKGSVAFAQEFEECEIDMGSGVLDMYITQGGANVITNIGSGAVNINAYGIDQKLTGEDGIMVGGGSATINISMGSGKINILESASAPQIEFTTPEVPVISNASDSSVASAVEPVDPVKPVKPVEPVVSSTAA